MESVLEMATVFPKLDEDDVTWFDRASLFPMKGGFKVYIPKEHLKTDIPTRIETVGSFKCHIAYNKAKLYYLEIPSITAEVLTGRKELK